MLNLTYTNLRHGITDFQPYVGNRLVRPNPSNCVSFLHSNASLLEAYFSLIRIYDVDIPLSYQSKIAIINDQKAMTEIKHNNKRYEKMVKQT